MSDNSNLQSYLFFVELDGIETARFQKCEGLEAETSVIEIDTEGDTTAPLRVSFTSLVFGFESCESKVSSTLYVFELGTVRLAT